MKRKRTDDSSSSKSVKTATKKNPASSVMRRKRTDMKTATRKNPASSVMKRKTIAIKRTTKKKPVSSSKKRNNKLATGSINKSVRKATKKIPASSVNKSPGKKTVKRATRKSPASSITKRISTNSATGSNEKAARETTKKNPAASVMKRKISDSSSNSKSVKEATRKNPVSSDMKRISSDSGTNSKPGSSVTVSTNRNVCQNPKTETSNEIPGTSDSLVTFTTTRNVSQTPMMKTSKKISETTGTYPLNPESEVIVSQTTSLVSKNSVNGMKYPTSQFLKFHAVHGTNVSLNARRTKASRNNDVNSLAYVFIEHALKLEETVHVKILRISSEVNGNFLYGVTSCDPSTLNPRNLPENADDLLDRPEYWIVKNDTHCYKAGDYFLFRINTRGEVSVQKNFFQKSTVFHVDPSQPLWLFFNMVGSVTEMNALYSSFPASAISEGSAISSFANEMASQTPETSSRIPGTSNPYLMNLEFAVEASHNRSLVSKSKDVYSTMDISSALDFNTNQISAFHAVHGKNVTLNSNRTIASRNKDFNSLAYVFTDNTLKLEEKIYVKILRTNPEFSGSFLYGITCCNPSTLNPHVLPENADDLLDRPEYWIVNNDANIYEAGDVITYSISSRGEVTVMKNCVHKSAVFNVDPTQPLWLFFNILGSVSEIKLLGSPVSYSFNRMSHQPAEIVTSNSIPGTSGSSVSNSAIRRASEIPNMQTCSAIPGTSGSSIFHSTIGMASQNPNMGTSIGIPGTSNSLFQNYLPNINSICYSAFRMPFHTSNTGTSSRIPGTSGASVSNSAIRLTSQTPNTVTSSRIPGTSGGSDSNSSIRMASQTSKVETSSEIPGTSGQPTECVICFGEQVDCAVYRCGHMCMCYSCASKMKKSVYGRCPICRNFIEDVIRIYR